MCAMALAERVLQGARSAEHVCPNITRLRNLFGLHNSDLARLTEINRETLARKLRGEAQFSAEELARIAAVWDLGVERLYDDQAVFRHWVADHEDELRTALEAIQYEDTPPMHVVADDGKSKRRRTPRKGTSACKWIPRAA